MKEKVAIVTGGAQSSGFVIAERLASLGAKIILADIDAATSEQAATKLRESGLSAIFFQTDIAERASVDALVTKTLET